MSVWTSTTVCPALALPWPSLAMLGILTVAGNLERRILIRQTWLANRPADIRATFLLGADQWSKVIESEAAATKDLCIVPETSAFVDTYEHGDQKAFAFLRAVLRYLPLTPFIMLADDDAYIYLPRVRADLQTVRSVPHVVYGALLWYSYDPSTGRNEGYARDVTTAVTRHPAAMRKYKKMKHNFSAPFPFMKGPCMGWSASVAREIADSDHGRALQAQSASVKRRVNLDSFIGYILATAQNGQGASNLTWVDIGVSTMSDSKNQSGFVEMRSGRNLTNPETACYRVAHFGTGQRKNMGNYIVNDLKSGRVKQGLKLASLLSRNVTHVTTSLASSRDGNERGMAVMRAGMTSLAGLKCSFPPWSRNQDDPMASCRNFAPLRAFSLSHGPKAARMSHGDSWTLCEVWHKKTNLYLNWKRPHQSYRRKMLNRQGRRWPPPCGEAGAFC